LSRPITSTRIAFCFFHPDQELDAVSQLSQSASRSDEHLLDYLTQPKSHDVWQHVLLSGQAKECHTYAPLA
jgi:hypothetical protein